MFVLLLLTASAWSWSPAPHDPGTLRLWDGDVLAGEYCTSTGVYRAWNGHAGRCDRVAEPPACLPAARDCNFGVDTSKLRMLLPRYRLSGMPVSREVAFQAIENKKLPDRTGQRWITAAGGSESQRKQLLDAIPQDVKSAARVNSYAHGDWPLRPGFPSKPDVPTLVVQRPDGGVIHQHEGVDVPAQLVAALREPDPKYDPKASPDLRKAFASAPRPPLPVALGGAMLAAAALVSFSRKKAAPTP